MRAGILLWVVLAADPEPSRGLTLEQAVRLAEERNPDLVAARRGIAVAEAGVVAAGALPNPTLSASYGPDDPRFFGIIEQRLPIFGQRGAAIGAARAEVPIAQSELAARQLDIRVRVRRAYAALSAAQARASLTEETTALSAELSRMAWAKFDTGTASEFEVEQADLTRRRAEQDLVDARAAVGSAQVELAGLIGEKTPSVLVASDPLWPLAEPPPLEALTERAASHPDVTAQLAQRDAARARAHVQRIALVPEPLVSIEFQRFPAPPDVAFGVRGTVAFDVPLLSWNRGAIEQEEARASQAEAAGAAARYVLVTRIESARMKWSAAAKRARLFQEELVPAAKRVVDLAHVAYQLGRTPLSNVLQAQADFARARTDAVNADLAAWDALAELEEASGASF